MFFSVHLIVQAAWSHPTYSWAANNISDLGNVYCQHWGDNHRYVCSSRHALMNLGFIGTGILITIGALLAGDFLRNRSLVRAARWLLVLDGFAFALAGL